MNRTPFPFKATTLLLALALVAFAGTAFASDSPSFGASVSLTGVQAPVLSLSNPSDHAVTVHAVAVSTARTVSVRVCPNFMSSPYSSESFVL
jgi:hypothetical protein